jgi:hypothetical protein
VSGGVVLGGVIAIGALLHLNFFGLFEPDELDRWEQPVARDLVEPPGDPFDVESLEEFVTFLDEELNDLFEEGPPAYTQDQADAWADELQPIVERVSGREFVSPPVLRVVDRSTLATALARHVREAYEAYLPALSDDYLDRYFAALSAWESVAMLGVYDPVDKVLYVVPTNVRAVMAAMDLDEHHYEPFVKLVVAHELTHALQDQVIDLSVTPPLGHTPDGQQAFQATIEGHAVFVEELVGAELSVGDSSVAMARMLSAGALPIDDPWFADICGAVNVVYEEIYLGGRDFIAHHHLSGGMDRVWEILAAPPAQTSMITRPDTYSPQAVWRPEFYRALKGIETVFGDDWKRNLNTRLNQFDLHGMYASLDGEQRDRLVATIEHARMMTLLRWPGGGNATLYVLILGDVADVEPFYEILDPTWDTAEPPGALAGLEADVNRFIVHDHEDAEEGESPHYMVHARRGRVIIDLRTFGGGLTEADLARVVESLLARLEVVVAP